MNSSLFAWRSATNTTGAMINHTLWRSLNDTIARNDRAGSRMLTPKTIGTIKANDAVLYLSQAMALFQSYSVVTLGQVDVFPTARVCANATTSTWGLTSSNKVTCAAPKMFGRMPTPWNTTTFGRFTLPDIRNNAL
jgi:hypothetical protein